MKTNRNKLFQRQIPAQLLCLVFALAIFPAAPLAAQEKEDQTSAPEIAGEKPDNASKGDKENNSKKESEKAEDQANGSAPPETKIDAKKETKQKAQQEAKQSSVKVIGEEEKTQRPIPEGPVLKNQQMRLAYEKTYMPKNIFEIAMINMLYGLVTGGTIGAAGGLNSYDSNDMTASQNAMITYGGIGGGFGALTGLGVTVAAKILDRSSVDIGYPLFEYSWYGAIAGFFMGAAAGTIPYQQSGNSDDIIHYGGYGAVAGFGTAVLYYALSKPLKVVPNIAHIELRINPKRSVLAFRYDF